MNHQGIHSKSAEVLAKWYLRFNGYFTIDNFVVHAGDDSKRISNNVIGNHTEIDILGLRHRYSREMTGPLEIQNDPKLIDKGKAGIDFIIVEVKTGSQNKPNKFWIEKKGHVLEYILRFAGFIEIDSAILKVANELSASGSFRAPDNAFSIRLVLISEVETNLNWKHIVNILIDEIIDFLIDIRGQCWIESNLGIRSVHYQWDPLLNEIFQIANNESVEHTDKKSQIISLLQTAV